MERKTFSRVLLTLSLAAAFAQFPRGVDFEGYHSAISASARNSFQAIPYPTAQVEQGAYFQSPVLTVLYWPLTWLPLFPAKLLWSCLILGGLVAVARKWLPASPSYGKALFLFLLFTYPLTDIFLSGNTNALLLLCLLSEKTIFLGLVGFLKPHALLFFPHWLLTRQYRRLVGATVAMAGWVVISLLVLSPEWWRRWVKSLAFYSHAAGPGRVSFQSPPAMAYRILDSEMVANAIGLSLALGLFVLAWRKREVGLALLLAALYVVTPFSWASSILFLFPLALHYLERGEPSSLAWVFVVIYAFFQKAFWPAAIWDYAIHRSLHGWCLLALLILFLLRVFGREPNWARGKQPSPSTPPPASPSFPG